MINEDPHHVHWRHVRPDGDTVDLGGDDLVVVYNDHEFVTFRDLRER